MSRQKSKSRGKKRSGQQKAYQKQNANPTLKFQIQFPKPEINKRLSVLLVPQISSPDPRTSNQLSPDGSSGSYLVTFVLSIPGKENFLEDINFDQLLLSGDSLLASPVVAEKLRVKLFNDQEAKEVSFFLNDQGRLSRVQIQVQADNILQAEQEAFNLVMPILSRWSFQHDVALDVIAYQVLEERTNVQKWTFNLLGKVKTLDINERGFSKPEYRTFFAAYREGANSSNPFYKFLCFYKVIDGVRKLRNQRKVTILAAGGPYREPPDEKIPSSIIDLHLSSPFEEQAFTPYLGEKFTRVTDEFRDQLRNVIAHLDPTQDCLEADRFEDVMACELAIPVIRYICRVMLNNEIKAELNVALPDTLVRHEMA